MKPLPPQEIYRRTAQRLNLPEEYVKDLVEYFYSENKKGMFGFSHVIFNISGLGRFIVKPVLFFKRNRDLNALVNKFKERRDDRGIMIRKELERRRDEFEALKPSVVDLFEYNKKRWYGYKENLEKQV